MTINQLQNRIQKNIVTQNEDELLKQLGLNDLIQTNNTKEIQQQDNAEQLQQQDITKTLFNSYSYTHSMKDDKSMIRQHSSQKIHHLPTFMEDHQTQIQLNVQHSKKNLYDEVITHENTPASGTWNNAIQEMPMQDSEWKIEKHESSNWSQDDQMMEKLQDQQQVSFSLQQQCFQREQNEGSEVQSDNEEFHIPLYSQNK